MRKSAIILANGDFPTRQELLEMMLRASLLICCDGAFNRLLDSGLFISSDCHPAIHIVGDGDSLQSTTEQMERLGARFIHGYTEQETNDLAKAVRYAVSLGISQLTILGATGRREDHTLGNIGHLVDFSAILVEGLTMKVSMCTDFGWFMVVRGKTKISVIPGQQISFFPFPQEALISATGVKYPIEQCRFRFLWEATLNEALVEEVEVEVEDGAAVLVYLAYPYIDS